MFAADEQQREFIVQFAHLVRGHQLAACLLEVACIGTVTAPCLSARPRVDRRLAQQFRHILMCGLLVAAQIKERVTVACDVFPRFFKHAFELRDILQDDRAGDIVFSACGQRLLEILRQRHVCELIH